MIEMFVVTSTCMMIVMLVHKRQMLVLLTCEMQMLSVTIAKKEIDKHAAC